MQLADRIHAAPRGSRHAEIAFEERDERRLPTRNRASASTTGRRDNDGLELLDRNLRARFFQLFLELFGIGLRNAFLDLAGNAFDQVLGFLEAQTGRAADDLDHADLLVAEAFEHHGELGLLGRSFSRTAATA